MTERLSNTKRRMLSRLGSRKMREKFGLFLVEGWKSVNDLLRDGSSVFEIISFVCLPEKADEMEKLAGTMMVSGSMPPPVYLAGLSEMREISTFSTPPEIIAVCGLPKRRDEDSILSASLPDGLYLLLDGVQDPGNLGTIIRTAHWFGIKKIYASQNTVDLYNPKTVQSSMGSMASVKVEYVDLEALIDLNPDIPLVGLMLEGNDIFRTPLPSSAFIAMGNEGNGLSEGLRCRLRLALTIPPSDPSDHAESLNVAIATAITLAEFRK